MGLIDSGINDAFRADACVDGANYEKANAISGIARAKAALATAALVKSRTLMDIADYEARLIVSLGDPPDADAVAKIEESAKALKDALEAIESRDNSKEEAK